MGGGSDHTNEVGREETPDVQPCHVPEGIHGIPREGESSRNESTREGETRGTVVAVVKASAGPVGDGSNDSGASGATVGAMALEPASSWQRKPDIVQTSGKALM